MSEEDAAEMAQKNKEGSNQQRKGLYFL